MKLQYLGHSCFRLISDMGTTIVCDPYNGKMVGFDMPRVRCDAVTVSHHHADHDCLDAIIGNPAVLDVVGVCTADDIAVASYETYHDDAKGAKRGKYRVYFCCGRYQSGAYGRRGLFGRTTCGNRCGVRRAFAARRRHFYRGRAGSQVVCRQGKAQDRCADALSHGGTRV